MRTIKMVRIKSTCPIVSYSVQLDRQVYYGNDQVTGAVEIFTSETVLLPVVRVAVVCRYLYKEEYCTKRMTGHTIYSADKIIGRQYIVSPGKTSIPFNFSLPVDMPVSINHALCNVKWDVRLFQTNGKINKSVAHRRFKASALYYSNFGSIPTTQVENMSASSGRPKLRAEAHLARDVYTEGAAIDVNLALHCLKRGVTVTSVNANVTQRIKFDTGGEGRLCTTKLDAAMLIPATWNQKWTKVNTGGKAFTHKFALVPCLPKIINTDTLAIQNSISKDGSRKATLPPSMYLTHGRKAGGLTVSYTVDLKVGVRGGSDLSFSLPFTLQGFINTDTISAISTNLRDCITFAVMPDQDLPPEYTRHKRESMRSYTSLRKNSLDTIFSLNNLNTVDSNYSRSLFLPKFTSVSKRSSHDIIHEEDSEDKLLVGKGEKWQSASFLNKFISPRKARNAHDADQLRSNSAFSEIRSLSSMNTSSSSASTLENTSLSMRSIV
eukprot:CFRG4438T1